jgi:hypothetical protein
MTLETAYYRLSQIPGVEIEPLEIITTVEQYRQFWRPEQVRVILLAESYVHTTVKDNNCRLKLTIQQKPGLENYPSCFARFVYCLAYGEDDLLMHPVADNPGTAQFWKIFYSCEYHVDGDDDFAPVKKTVTPYTYRIRNKIRLLERLKADGVWLLDASIMALYGRKNKLPLRTKKQVITTCWDSYIKELIVEACPQHLICVGKGVARALQDRLDLLSRSAGITTYVIPQPQARLRGDEHIHNYQRYYAICHNEKA